MHLICTDSLQKWKKIMFGRFLSNTIDGRMIRKGNLQNIYLQIYQNNYS